MLQDEKLHKLIDCIVTAHLEDHMDCESCGSQIECLAERVAMGANLHELLPEVETHLACCRDCFEEFEALVAILRAENSGEIRSEQV